MPSLDSFQPDFPLEEAIASASRAPSLSSFRRSDFYRAHGSQLDRWLHAVRSGAPSPGSAPLPAEAAAAAPAPEGIRIAHWNIQQGKAWDAILSAIDREPLLRSADLWTLNEVDVGTARVNNRNVIEDLADHLGLHWAFVANYLELTKGPGADREAPGENRIGLHGLGLLSRWPIAEAGSADLIECHDYFRFPEEKRYGCRRVLWGTIRHPRSAFLIATAHLEVRNTPACRARQMRRALAALPEGPAWFTGDWNTNTFRRRSLIQQAREFARLQRTREAILDRDLLEPWAREPLLRLVEEAGFSIRPWNEALPTARQILSGVEELKRLPGPLRRVVEARFRLDRRILRMRLDWIAARGPWRPATGPEGVWTLPHAGPEGSGASDHAPIGATAAWKGIRRDPHR